MRLQQHMMVMTLAAVVLPSLSGPMDAICAERQRYHCQTRRQITPTWRGPSRASGLLRGCLQRVGQRGLRRQRGCDYRYGIALAVVDDIIAEKGSEYAKPPNGIVLAYICSSTELVAESEPIQVWKYRDGGIVAAPPVTYRRAMSDDRKHWPPKTFEISIISVGGETSVVRVVEHYDIGLRPDGRGGNLQQWKLERREGKWRVTERQLLGNGD